MLISAQWEDTAANTLVQGAAADITREIDATAKDMGLLHEFIYLNYANQVQDPIGSYGSENAENLTKASRMYDPKGVFQKQVPGGFKLGFQESI